MITLTKDNFDQEIASGLVFVKFSVKNGCRYCTEFKPKYLEASLAETGAKFCEYETENLQTEDDICKKHQISSFPTVLAFENGVLQGKMEKYKFYSNRDLQGLIFDEQKLLFNKQCYVEDLNMEMARRQETKMAIERNKRIETLQEQVQLVKTEIEQEQKVLISKIEAEKNNMHLDFLLPNETAAVWEIPHCEACG